MKTKNKILLLVLLILVSCFLYLGYIANQHYTTVFNTQQYLYDTYYAMLNCQDKIDKDPLDRQCKHFFDRMNKVEQIMFTLQGRKKEVYLPMVKEMQNFNSSILKRPENDK